MDKSLVSKATSADDAVTPGYLYREIAKISHVSVDASGQLRDFLLKKVKSSNVNQKFKALKVLKHVCQQGHPTFRRDLQRNTSDIKECLGAAGHLAARLRGSTLSPPPVGDVRAQPPGSNSVHAGEGVGMNVAVPVRAGYRGTPDPLTGDAKNKDVRDMAQVPIMAVLKPS
jgi:hypothetical protein